VINITTLLCDLS